MSLLEQPERYLNIDSIDEKGILLKGGREKKSKVIRLKKMIWFWNLVPRVYFTKMLKVMDKKVYLDILEINNLC